MCGVGAIAWAIHGLTACAELKTASDNAADAGDAAEPSPFELVHSYPVGENLVSIWGADDENIVAVGSQGVKYQAVNGAWQRSAVSTGRDYLQVWGTTAKDIYVVGVIRGNNKGVIEHFNGSAWTDEYIAATPIWSVWGDGEVVLAVGPGGHIYGKAQGTTDWDARGRLTEPDVPDFIAVAGNGPSNLTLVAERRIYHTNNFGDFPWFEPRVDTTLRFSAAWSSPGRETSIFLGTNHLGVAWMYSPSKIKPNLVDAGTLVEPDASLEDITVVTMFSDEGSPESDTRFIRGIAGHGTKRYFVGDEGRVYAFDILDTGVTHIPSGTTDSLIGAWASDKYLWVAGMHELVIRAPLP